MCALMLRMKYITGSQNKQPYVSVCPSLIRSMNVSTGYIILCMCMCIDVLIFYIFKWQCLCIDLPRFSSLVEAG